MNRLYTWLFALGLPLILGRLWWRGRTLPAYRQRLGERLGLPSRQTWNSRVTIDPARKTIWLHAVSVGETIAATPLLEYLLAQNIYNLVVTTTTPTGSERLLAKFAGRVIHVYMPYDLPVCIKAFCNRYQPQMLVIMETELWPNTLAWCARNNIPTLLANARLSAKSARGYLRFASLSRALMKNLTVVAAQNAADGQRFIDLGLAPDKLFITGNIKFDVSLTPTLSRQAGDLRGQLGGRPVLIAGSTHPGEEAQILDAFAEVLHHFPNTLLILVPRHPDRFATVAQLCQSRHFTLARRSQRPVPLATDAILLGDTMGELNLLYGVADCAFIGNSLNGGGGHNLLEAALWSVPIVSGPGVFNFQQIADELTTAEALLVVHNAAELTARWQALLAQPQLANTIGERAKTYVEQQRGALAKLILLIENKLR